MRSRPTGDLAEARVAGEDMEGEVGEDMGDEPAGPDAAPAAAGRLEPTNEQIRERIDELMSGVSQDAGGSPTGIGPAVRAELDQLWLMLRARDVGPETQEGGRTGSA